MPLYQQLQLRHPQAQQFATEVCHMLPNCAQAHLVVWNTGNTDRSWQIIVQVHPTDPRLVPRDLKPLQQQVRTYAHTSTFLPVREQADRLMLAMQ
jgi:hypothetical protein